MKKVFWFKQIFLSKNSHFQHYENGELIQSFFEAFPFCCPLQKKKNKETEK